jgi:hypothetical protein
MRAALAAIALVACRPAAQDTDTIRKLEERIVML